MSIFPAAARSPLLATDLRKFAAISLIAPIARASVWGVARSDMYDSMAWVNASIPVGIMTLGGTVETITGSRKAILGTILLP